MRNRTYGGVRGRKTKVGEKLLRFPPTRFVPLQKKIPQQDGLETIPVGGILILKKFTLMNYLAKSNHIICFCNYQDPCSGSRDKH